MSSNRMLFDINSENVATNLAGQVAKPTAGHNISNTYNNNTVRLQHCGQLRILML